MNLGPGNQAKSQEINIFKASNYDIKISLKFNKFKHTYFGYNRTRSCLKKP